MRAIQIDPHTLTLTEVDVISIENLFHGYAQRVPLAPNITMYVDEEGLLRKDQRFWSFLTSRNPAPIYGGSGFVVWEDDEREPSSLPTAFTTHGMMQMVTWLGGAEQTEATIKKGLADRPQQTLQVDNDPPQVIWSWEPSKCEREPLPAPVISKWEDKGNIGTHDLLAESTITPQNLAEKRAEFGEMLRKAVELIDSDPLAGLVAVSAKRVTEEGNVVGLACQFTGYNVGHTEMKAVIASMLDTYVSMWPGDGMMANLRAVFNLMVKKQEAGLTPKPTPPQT